jgi:CubicO group peptidase (beta-lactamase class C family)
MVRRFCVLAVVGVFAGATTAGQASGQSQPAADELFPKAAPEAVGMSSEKLRASVDLIHRLMERRRITGAVLLVIRDGRMVLHEAVGWADRERQIPMRRDQIVSMRSMTKPLIGTAILMLREEGKLQLEDRVSKYLPSFDNDKSREITVFQLLTHTSGIKGEIYTATGGTTFRNLREAVDAVGARGPEFPPGTDYFYSDPGTSTLAALIAERSGMPAEKFISTRILQPLGMKDSFLVDDATQPLRPRVAAAYRMRPDSTWLKYWDNTMAPVVPFFRGSGGLYATALDYARFMAAILARGTLNGTRILTPASVELSTQPHAAAVFTPERRAEMNRFYGLNWDIWTDKFRPVDAPFASGMFEHAGSDGTVASADPKRRLIVVYLTQNRGEITRRMVLRSVYGAIVE